MASSPTALLKIEKPGTGDKRDTWGVSEGDAKERYDEAIAGVLTKTITADVTLTATQYIANEARMAIYNLTGSLAGVSKIVTIPSVAGKHLVYNNSGADLSFKTSLGSAVTVRNGMQSWIWSDGTDTYVVDPTLDQIKAPDADVSLNSKKLTSVADPASAQDGATKNYVDTRKPTDLTLITTSFNFNNQKGVNVATPTANGDAVNKSYADGLSYGASLPTGSVAGQIVFWNGSQHILTTGALLNATGTRVKSSAGAVNRANLFFIGGV